MSRSDARSRGGGPGNMLRLPLTLALPRLRPGEGTGVSSRSYPTGWGVSATIPGTLAKRASYVRMFVSSRASSACGAIDVLASQCPLDGPQAADRQAELHDLRGHRGNLNRDG